MKPVYVMIGGFLGAGKTTTISRLARHYIAEGKKVGIVTNDQAADLVDTQTLRSQGFDVGEVAGACFCCNFDALTSTVEHLGENALPEVILAEPVGSCTDLVATVIRPLTEVYGVPLDVAPYGVILKPSHGLRILRRESKAGFSPKAEYIFLKQLEEADFIIINRIDELPPEEVAELHDLLSQQFPDQPILRFSAKTGEGFDALTEMLSQRGRFGRRVMELDYDLYAEGEAELGWLNSQVAVQADDAFELDALLFDIVRRLHERLRAAEAEVAHLKVIGLCADSYAVANLVSNATTPELSLASHTQTRSANIVVNARVATEPEQLEACARSELADACAAVSASFDVVSVQSLRPGRPVPTHRIVDSTG